MQEIISYVDNPRFLQTIIAALIGVLGIIVRLGFGQVVKIVKDEKNNNATKLNQIANRMDNIDEKLIKINNAITLNNESTIHLLYHQCLNEALKWKDKGYIELGAKKYFENMWNNYVKLGDGLGSEPFDIVDKLEMKP